MFVRFLGVLRTGLPSVYFVHSRHHQDFFQSELANRVLRDLEHNRHRPDTHAE